jgi:uncharacterized protein
MILAEDKFNVVDLVELQLTENAISARMTEIENTKNSSELTSARKELEMLDENFNKLNSDYTSIEANRKKMEDSVELQNEKIKTNEKKLFSGTITSAKELENYQDEVRILKQKNSEMEDKILEMMIEMDEKVALLNKSKAERDKAESDVNRINNEINEKVEVLKNILEGLKKRKENVTSRIPQDYLNKYEELKKKKGGIAVSVIKDNFCNVCNMELPVSALEEIEDIDKVYRCPLCGRMAIIYRQEIDDIKKELEP